MKKTMSAAVVGVMSLVSTNSWANLLTNGDFEAAAPVTAAVPFLIGSNLSKWIAVSGQYTLSSPGPSGVATDDFAQHRITGGGTDEKLVQFISGAGLTGGTLTLNFDYLYQEAAGFDPQARISLIGISADRLYNISGGTGTDGLYNGNGDYAVASPDVLLGQATLAYASSWITNQSLLSSLISSNFFAIGVIVQSGCFGSTTCNTLRGFDNFSLVSSNQVPAPGTLALLGLGLIGLGLTRRKAA